MLCCAFHEFGVYFSLHTDLYLYDLSRGSLFGDRVFSVYPIGVLLLEIPLCSSFGPSVVGWIIFHAYT